MESGQKKKGKVTPRKAGKKQTKKQKLYRRLMMMGRTYGGSATVDCS